METALLHTLNSIYSSADRSQSTLLVSFDLNAAFDTIDHKILVNTLSNSFGISVSAPGWLTSYLSNRSQLVPVGQATSIVTHCISCATGCHLATTCTSDSSCAWLCYTWQISKEEALDWANSCMPLPASAATASSYIMTAATAVCVWDSETEGCCWHDIVAFDRCFSGDTVAVAACGRQILITDCEEWQLIVSFITDHRLTSVWFTSSQP